MNSVKIEWKNKYRNIILIVELLMFIIYAFFILYSPPGYFEFVLNGFLKGIPLNIIFAAIFIAYNWRHLNRIKEGDLSSTRTDISGWILIAFLFLSSIYVIFTGKELPFPFNFVLNSFYSSCLIYSVTMYPLILYWERNNMMTIYFVEEKPSRWRPVALSDQGF